MKLKRDTFLVLRTGCAAATWTLGFRPRFLAGDTVAAATSSFFGLPRFLEPSPVAAVTTGGGFDLFGLPGLFTAAVTDAVGTAGATFLFGRPLGSVLGLAETAPFCVESDLAFGGRPRPRFGEAVSVAETPVGSG